MATTYNNDIQKLYVAYFNRPADPAGLAYWADVVSANGGDTASVSAQFATSAEYTAEYDDMTNAEIVNAVYNNLFGRDAETAGQDYWAAQLNSGAITIDGVVTAIAGGALGTDLTSYNNKVAAASAFTAAVDTPAEMAGYAGEGNTAAKAWLATITTDASLSAAIAPGALNATVAEVVAAGTEFTVAGALAALESAQDAYDAFVASVGKDVNGDTVVDATDIQTASTNASAAVAAGLSNESAAALYSSANTSATVKAALVNDQVAMNAGALATAQAALSEANADVGAVAGLSTAISTLASAETNLTNAQTTQTSAAAALAAQSASFGVINPGAVISFTTGGNAVVTMNGTETVVGTVTAAGRATLASGIDDSDFAGIVALTAAYNANTLANTGVTNATAAVTAAEYQVNHLDTTPAEATELAAVTSLIRTYGDVTIASNATATEAQIATQAAILEAKAAAEADANGAAHTNLTAFTNAVSTYHTAAEANPLVDAQTAATGGVTAATKTITDFNAAVAAANTASANVTNLAGYAATLEAAQNVFGEHDYTLVSNVGATAIASVDSDVYNIVGTEQSDITISLFGLQGTDSLFLGSGYSLVQGAIGATGVTANNAALEVFVSSNDAGDAVLQVETSAFGSSAATPEVVTITLVGVDADTIALNNGIVTGTQATA